MARTTERNSKRNVKETRTRGKKKVCVFCKEHAEWVDYKDVATLRRFMSERGKIRSRRVTGNCAQHQRDVQVAIKNAREVALLPYVQRTSSERGLGRSRTPAGQDSYVGPQDAGEGSDGAYQRDSDVDTEPAPVGSEA